MLKCVAKRRVGNLTSSTAALASSAEQQYGLSPADTHVFLLFADIYVRQLQ